MVAEEIEGAEYKNRQGQEDLSSEEAGPVAELTRLPPGYPALLEELKTRIRSAQLRSALNPQPGDHSALLVYRTGPLLPLCGRGMGN